MDILFIIIGFIGLITGAIRVIPQTILTIRTKITKNLSPWYFNCHALAAQFALIYEILRVQPSMINIIFFVFVICTNLIQSFYIYYFRIKHRRNPPWGAIE